MPENQTTEPTAAEWRAEREAIYHLLDATQKERDRLRAALHEIVEHCANTGYGNPIVDNRTVDRCEETAMTALERGK